jgi:hypothetical protein
MGRYPPVQHVTPRLVRFFGFSLWGPIPSGLGRRLSSRLNLSASRAKRCTEFTSGNPPLSAIAALDQEATSCDSCTLTSAGRRY